MSDSHTDTRFMSRDFVTKFIEIYKSHSALWKTKSKAYSNRKLKNRGYEALVNYCKLYVPNANRDFVTKKIQNMRGCFRKELKKVEVSRRNGGGLEDLYEPRLWYFDLLIFTKDQDAPCQSLEIEVVPELDSADGQMSEGETVQEDGEVIHTEISTISLEKPDSPPKAFLADHPSVKRRLVDQQTYKKMISSALQPKHPPDEFEAIATNVAVKLRRMNSTQQLLAEGLIHKVLLKGLFNELSRATDVIDSLSQDDTTTIIRTGETCTTYLAQ